MVRIITMWCFKGGVGKTTYTELMCYLLSKEHDKKVLLIDADPQGDLSDSVKRTYADENMKVTKTLYTGIQEFDLSSSIINLDKNVDLLHSDWDLEKFEKYLMNNVEAKGQYYLLYTLLADIKNEYDYIIFDTSPRTTDLTSNAICASDYVIIPTETKHKGVRGVRKTYQYLGDLLPYNKQMELVGILPYLSNEKGAENRRMLKLLRSEFEEDIYSSVIKVSDRVITWGSTGVKNIDRHDNNTMKMYRKAVNETLERIEKIERE